MIVVGIGAVVSLGFSTLITQLFKGIRSARISQDAENMANGITLALSKATCTTALVPTPTMAAGWTSVALTEIRMGTTVLASTTAPVGNLITNSITLTPEAGPFDIKVNTTTPPAAPAVETMKRYVVRLRIQQSKQSSGGTNTGGNSMGEKTFFLSAIARPSAGDIMYSCFGGEDRDFLEEMCERQLGGVYDENENPSCRLARLAIADGSFAMRDTMLDTSTSPGSYLSVTDETTPHNAYSPALLTLRSINSQANLILRGRGEDNAISAGVGTHAQISFIDENNVNNKWRIAYKNDNITSAPEQRGALMFLRSDDAAGVIDSFPLLLTTNGRVVVGPDEYTFLMPQPRFLVNGNTQLNGQLSVAMPSTFTGDVAINSGATPGNLTVAGNLSVGGTITAVGTITSSDATLKKNVHDLDNILDRISDLRPVSFEWKGKRKPAGTQYGFIAQEVQKSFPELVVKTPSGTLGVKYDQLSPILLKAMQEMIIQNQEMITQNQELRSRIEALEQTLEQRCK